MKNSEHKDFNKFFTFGWVEHMDMGQWLHSSIYVSEFEGLPCAGYTATLGQFVIVQGRQAWLIVLWHSYPPLI